MAVGNHRKSEDIKIKLSEIIRRAGNPLFERVTLASIKLSPDSAQALVLFSAFGLDEKQQEEVAQALNKSAGFFQGKLGKSLTSRNTPRLKFVYDKGFDQASHIDQLLHQIKE